MSSSQAVRSLAGIQQLWSENEYFMSDFIIQHGQRIPVVICIAEGYSGADELHSVSVEDIYLVYGVIKQQRYVVEDENQQLYSIPESYHRKFVLKRRKQKSEPLYIREVAKEARSDRRLWGSPPKIAVDMIDDESSFACVTDAVSGKMIVLRDLFLIDSYDEAYLCAVGLDFKKMQVGEHITLPTYVNYTFNIADKINDTTPLDELYGLAQRSSPPKEKCNLCNEIVQLRVARSSSSNSIRIYERVQLKHEEPYYKKIGENPAHKAHSKMPPYSSDPDKTTVRDQETFPKQNSSNSLSPVHYYSEATLSPRSPESSTEQFQSQSVVVGVVQPALPPRARKPIDRVHSRRKQPAIPPDQRRYEYVEIADIQDVDDPTSPTSGCSVEEMALQTPPAASGESPTERLQSPSEVGDDSDGKPTVPIRLRKPVDRAYSRRKVPTPPLDHAGHQYSDIAAAKYVFMSEHHTAAEVPTTGSDDEEPYLQPTAAISQLSVEDVAECLRQVRLDAFVEAFQQQGVDGALLSNIDEEMLTEDFAMSRFEAKKLIMGVKYGWRPKKVDNMP